MKTICFKCCFVAWSIPDPRCPECGFPLIQDAAAEPLEEEAFEQAARGRSLSAPPLPGVSAGPRKAQLLEAKRKERVRRLKEAQRLAARKAAQRKMVAEICAASAVLALALVAIRVLL